MRYSGIQQLSWLWGITAGQRWQLATYIMLRLIAVAFSLCFVYWSRMAVDIATGRFQGDLSWIVALIIASALLGLVLEQIASWMAEAVKIKMTARLQVRLAGIQMRTCWSVAKRRRTGDLLVRLTTDVAEVAQMLSIAFPSFCVTCFKLLASFLFLWLMDPALAVFIMAISPLFLFARLYYRKMRMLSKVVKQAESLSGTVLQENLRHRLLIRGLHLIAVRNARYQQVQHRICRLKLRRLRFSTTSQGIFKSGFSGGYLFAFLWGVYRLHNAQISFGTLTAFLQLVGRVQTPVLNVLTFVPGAVRCSAATERLMVLLEDDYEVEQEALPLLLPLDLKLDHLSFGYGNGWVIRQLTAHISSGVPTAITGATGRGKTTLIRLILGLLVPDEGNLSFECNGQSRPVSVATRCNFSYVPQGNTLFCGTIRQNLMQVCPEASEAQLSHALHVACADFVHSLAEGLDTLLGESGQGLSEGQAQRIAIARAVLRNAPVWLFDEATSALDAFTTKHVVSNLLQAGRDRIIIFVTHNSRIMEACRQVIRLD